MDIKESVILITSAGSSLGSTLVDHFSSLGAKVIAIDTHLNQLDKLIAQGDKRAGSVLAYPVEDYSDNCIQQLFSTIKEELQLSVDVLINYWPSQPLPMLISADNSQQFSDQLVSLASPIFSFGQACALHMKKNDGNSLIINMITYPIDEQSSGLESATSVISGFTKSWAKELEIFNIRVGAVIPGISHKIDDGEVEHWAYIQDEFIRSAEYIVSNEYFNGRVMSAEM